VSSDEVYWKKRGTAGDTPGAEGLVRSKVMISVGGRIWVAPEPEVQRLTRVVRVGFFGEVRVEVGNAEVIEARRVMVVRRVMRSAIFLMFDKRPRSDNSDLDVARWV